MRILIVDDHPIVRAGLRRLLASEGAHELAEAEDGKAALALARASAPDLVILDLNLPGLGGLELIRRLKLAAPPPRILVLSMHDDALHAARALQEGADGYVSKNAGPAQILEGIRRLAEGGQFVAPELAQELALRSVRAPAHPLERLSRRDLELLRLLGEGRSLQQIADALGLSYKTIANGCGLIRAKLGVRRTADLIRIAVQHRIAAEPSQH
jgi:DNA-binding NarL/FixJ family response regulator